jgi:hypothetical protein
MYLDMQKRYKEEIHLLVGGYWLVVIGWWLLVGGYWLVVIG